MDGMEVVITVRSGPLVHALRTSRDEGFPTTEEGATTKSLKRLEDPKGESLACVPD